MLTKVNVIQIRTFQHKTERIEKEPICLVCPMISDRFNITLNAAAVNNLYISFPKPASDAFPITNPCLQNCSGGSSRILGAPEMRNFTCIFLKISQNEPKIRLLKKKRINIFNYERNFQIEIS